MIDRLLWNVGASLALAASPITATSVSKSCDGSDESNRTVVLAFYTEGLIARQPEKAFIR